MERQTQISVNVPQSDLDEVLHQLHEEHVEVISTIAEGFDGTKTAELLCTLTPVVVGALVKIYTKRMDANKAVAYKAKGIEIKGVSEAALLKLVELYGRTKDSSTPGQNGS